MSNESSSFIVARRDGRVLGMVVLFERGRPRTDALRQKSVRVLVDSAFCWMGASRSNSILTTAVHNFFLRLRTEFL
jgi:hypothetical protein